MKSIIIALLICVTTIAQGVQLHGKKALPYRTVVDTITTYYNWNFSANQTLTEDSLYLYDCTSAPGVVLTFSGNSYAENNGCAYRGAVTGTNTPTVVFINSSVTVGDVRAFSTATGEVRSYNSHFYNNSPSTGNDYPAFHVRDGLSIDGSVAVVIWGGSFINGIRHDNASLTIVSDDTIEVVEAYGNGRCLVDTSAGGSYSGKIKWGGNRFRRQEIVGGATGGKFDDHVWWANEDHYEPGELIFAQLNDTLRTYVNCAGGDSVAIHMLGIGLDDVSNHTAYYYTYGGIDLRGGNQFFKLGHSGVDSSVAVTNIWWGSFSFAGFADTDVLAVVGIPATGYSVITTMNETYDADDSPLSAKRSDTDQLTIERPDGTNGTENGVYSVWVTW